MHYSTANTSFLSPREQVVVNLHTAVKEGNVRQLEESLSGGSDCETLDEDLVSNCDEGIIAYNYNDNIVAYSSFLGLQGREG